MVLLIAAIIVAGAIVWGCLQIVGGMRALQREMERVRVLDLLSLFRGALDGTGADARSLLAWEPVVRVARQLFPDEVATLDQAWGAAFPFGTARVEAAHAQWTTEWLLWERAHDADYKLKAAVAEEELKRSEGSPAARARLEAIEHEKLERYQRRYEEYVRIGKALQALAPPARAAGRE